MQPFAAIVGAEHVHPPACPKLADATIEAVVEPGTAHEVAACLAAARGAGVPVVAKGGGSKLHWGNPPDRSPVVLLDLTRLNDVPVLDPEEGIVTVGGGVKVEELARASAAQGARTSLPDIFPGASVGGTIATDPVSPAHSPERRARNDLLGLEIALPNGELTRAGGKVVKNVTGFDLVRLYFGSFGTLGVITEATLRLRSVPAARRVLRRDFGELETALRVSAELVRAPLELGGVGLLGRGERTELLWLLEGSETSVAEFASRFEGDAAEPDAWEALGREIGAPLREPGTIRARLSARPSDAMAICRRLEQRAGASALRLVLPRMGVVLAEPPEDSLAGLWEDVKTQRWLLFLEHLPPGSSYDAFGPEPEGLPLMRALKARFDPDRVLAPGRYVGGI